MFQLSGPVLENSDESEPDPGFQSNLAAARVLWPPTDPEEVKRQVEIRRAQTFDFTCSKPVRPDVTD